MGIGMGIGMLATAHLSPDTKSQVEAQNRATALFDD